jgi:DNA repair exonuclease SbcCD ATPase subunit
MAKEVIAYSIEADSNKAGKSLSDLKKEFKEGQKELSNLTKGTKEYIAQLERLGGLRDDIGDLRDTINAFNPDQKFKALSGVIGGVANGFSAVTSATALFGSQNEELEKTLVKVQAAMAFSQSINQLGELKDGFKNLGLVIKAAFASNPLGLIATGVAAIATALTAFYYSMDKSSDATKELNKQLEVQKASNEILSRQIEREIGALKAQGASEEEVIKVKRRLILAKIQEVETSIKLHESKIRDVQDNNSIQESYLEISASIQRKLGNEKAAEVFEKAIQENKKGRAKEDLDAIEKEKQDLLDFKQNFENLKYEEINLEKKKTENYITELGKRKDAELKHRQDIQRMLDESAIADLERRINSAQTFEEKQKDEFAAMDEIDSFYNSLEEKKSEQRKELTKEEVNSRIDTYQSMADGIKNITDLIFSFQLNHAKGNAVAEKQIRRKQFNVNKAYGATSATIDGIQAVQKTLATGGALAIPASIGVGAMATANVLKILSQKFDESGGGSSQSAINVTAPTITSPSQGSTQLNADGTVKQPISNNENASKVYLVETDVTKSQKRVSSIELNSKI